MKKNRFNPMMTEFKKCRICKQKVHQPGMVRAENNKGTVFIFGGNLLLKDWPFKNWLGGRGRTRGLVGGSVADPDP
jgi:hypothetical protein